ncbi:fatty acid--CoA ligase family protein [Actinomadura madurae]|nr:AMP-binding protein [Actinomadura madurae]MCP9970738.1 fatty acid--CoA ligase family protein [Actinomadura madurae]
MSLFPGSLLAALRESPRTPAFEHAGRVVSRGELLGLIGTAAAGLRDAGFRPGTGLAVRAEVSPEAFAAQVAAHVVGCRVVGVRPGYPAGQLAHVLGMGVDAVLVDAPGATPEMLAAAGTLPVLPLGTLLDGPAAGARHHGPPGRRGAAGVHQRQHRAAEGLRDHLPGAERALGVAAARLGAGRGGVRRGVRAVPAVRHAGQHGRLRVPRAVPARRRHGGDPRGRRRPLFPYAIERYGITGSIVTVPRLGRMLGLLRDDPAAARSLRALMVSGSPLGPHRLAEAVERLGPVVYNGYGQTEAGSISMLTPAGIAAGDLASVGRPHPGVEIDVEAGTGEILVRSPSMMAGYWDDPGETRDVLRDGWLRTRDLGRLDGDGRLHLSGRARDVIMVNAMVVYAGPIERVLAGHPDVAEAYVAGAPDEETGEAVHAFVVPAHGRRPGGRALRDLVRDELGADSVPRTITVVPAVPTSAGGKPDKRALLDGRF